MKLRKCQSEKRQIQIDGAEHLSKLTAESHVMCVARSYVNWDMILWSIHSGAIFLVLISFYNRKHCKPTAPFIRRIRLYAIQIKAIVSE